MSLSFEELADGSIPNPEVSSSVGHSKISIYVGVVCVIVAGCGAYLYSPQPSIPEAAEILLSVKTDVPGVLPHDLDSATEFKESFEYLKEGTVGPKLRVSEPESIHKEDFIVDSKTGVLPVEESLVTDMDVGAVALSRAPVVEPKVVTKVEPKVVTKEVIDSNSKVVFDRDWGGMVLVPDTAKLAKAHTTVVQLTRIEAHPIDGEYLRVWARIQNLTDQQMDTQVGCEFRSSQYQLKKGVAFEPMSIPAGGHIDVHFVSPQDRVESYTVLVKRHS